MEGVGYSLLHNLQTAAAVGVNADILRSVGGTSGSWVWTQIKADITGKTIQVSACQQATSLGAAILAGIGVGVYKDFADAVEKTVHMERTHDPNPQNAAIYERYYQLYLALYKNLQQLFPLL